MNSEKDANGFNWAKKSMVQCGLDVPADGVWKVDQLTRKLREIVAVFPEDFAKGYNESSCIVSL